MVRLSFWTAACFFLMEATVRTSADTTECEHKQTCDACISRSSTCVWCLDAEFGSNRCNSHSNLVKQGCQTIINPETEIEEVVADGDGEFFNIRPQSVNVTFRKGTRVSFDVVVELKKYPQADVVFVLDASKSIEYAKEQTIALLKNFAKVGPSLGFKRIGITSFVDMTSHPTIYHKKFSEAGEDRPFNFNIVAPLSEDIEEVTRALESLATTVNMDYPENLFGALVQTTVCEKMRWSSEDNVVRYVIAFTNEMAKSQGDGRPMGVTKPNDMKCHTDEKGLDLTGMSHDYPSVGQTGYTLMKSNIEVVFAITPKVKSFYQAIKDGWSNVNTVIVDLNINSFNLLEILNQTRNELASRVKLYYEAPTTGLKVKITANCGDFDNGDESNECINVQPGSQVRFSVEITHQEDFNKGKITFFVSSLGKVEFNYDTISQCECSKTVQPGAQSCSNNGNLVCGACICNSPRAGQSCQCNSKTPNLAEKCMNRNTGTVCSGRGFCDQCGTCNCYTAPDGFPYSGDHCQCGRTWCRLQNNLLCGGPSKGTCKCDRCECKEEFLGSACELDNCAAAGISGKCTKKEGEESCSGLGDCVCGKCHCPLNREGVFCESEAFDLSCQDFENVANCALFDEDISTKLTCENSPHEIELVDVLENPCVALGSNGCNIYFTFNKPDNKKVEVKVKRFIAKTDCPEKLNVALIAGCVFAALAGVGVLAIIIYIVTVTIYYKVEYNHHMREMQNVQTRQANPLYEPVQETERPGEGED